MEICTLNAFLGTLLCVFATPSGQGLRQLETDYCSSLAYNPVNQICCEGIIQTRSSAHTACCGQDVYITTTHTCCANGRKLELKGNLSCCGRESFNTTIQHCCSINNRLEVKLKNEICSLTPSATASESKSSILIESTLNCSGTPYKRKSSLIQCCGKDLYSLSDDNVLCCNGILLRNVPEQSECVGGLIYTQKKIKMICGSEVYDHHKQVCCSGRRFDKSSGECCGNILLKHNTEKICCSSSTHAMIYDKKTNHHCCGHYYYNTSLWSCCAEHLKPTPSHNSSRAGHMLKPMMDLIPDLCNKTVLFGKVESVILHNKQRHVVLRVIVKIDGILEGPLLHVSLDHCGSPALENGMTYLWGENNRQYKPLSIPVNVTTDVLIFFTACNLMQALQWNLNPCSRMLHIQDGFSMQGNV